MTLDASIQTRPLEPHDFGPLAHLMLEVWGPSDAGQPEELSAQALLASYLECAAWGRVALQEDQLVGAVLAGMRDTMADRRHQPQACHWPYPTLGSVLARACEIDPGLPDRMRAQHVVEVEEAHVTRELQARPMPESDATVQLLIVSERVRGRHVGSALFDAARRWMRSQGARGYFLMTDDECDYGFYDHAGLRRLRCETLGAPSTDPSDKPFHVYAYGERLS